MASRRDSYTEETVAALTAAGRTRFGREGYEAAGLEVIAADAGVTTGAIYHHFSGKKGLFLAVAEQIEQDLMDRALAVTDEDPWRGLKRAFETLLDACARPDVQRIIFLEAPRVIGPEAWRAIELRYAFGAMSVGLSALVEAGVVRPYKVEIMAPVLLSVLAETSRAAASDPGLRTQAVEIMMRVLDCLRADAL